MKLLILDGDDTLWQPVDGVCISDRWADDPIGNLHFTYQPNPADPDEIKRPDGIRLRLNPGARALLARVTERGGTCAIASYNHRDNIVRALAAWGIGNHFTQVVAHWHSRKNEMLAEILAAEAARGHAVAPAEALFVDDDPYGTYRGYAGALGMPFVQMGGEIRSLEELLDRV